MSRTEDLRTARESRADVASRAGRPGLGRGDAMTRMVDTAVYRASHRSSRQTRPGPAAPRTEWGTLATPDGTVRYLDTGAGTGTPVLLVHGLFEDPATALVRYGALVPDGCRIIAPARYGYAGSTLPAGATPARQADAFATLLDQLGIAKTAVVALSSGANSALQLAIRHRGRVAALALVAPNGPGCQHDRPAVPHWLASAVWRSEGLTRLARSRVVMGLARRTGRWMVVPQACLDEQHLGGALFDTYVSDPDVNRGYEVDRIVAPTLVACAPDDTRVPYWGGVALVEIIPGAHIVSLAHAGELDACADVRALLKSTSD